MTGSLPPGVRVLDLDGGTRYVLPVRPLEAARGAASAPMFQGLGVAASSLVVTALFMFGLLEDWRAGIGPIVLAVALLTLVPLPFGWVLILRGLRILLGSGELEVRGRSLVWRERLAGLRWSRSRPFDRVSHVGIEACEAPAGFLPRLPRVLRQTGVVRFAFDGGATLFAARYYPREFLHELLQELDRRHGWNAFRAAVRPTPRPPPGSEPVVREPRVVPRPPPGSEPRRQVEPGITILPDSPPEEGTSECQVCGAGMTEDLVACERCRTLHHRACWDYVGRCSTFGCGSGRAAREI